MSRGSVLLADDDDALRQLVTRALTADGYSVNAVANGDDAIAMFASQPFDVVLTDVDMPGRNGIELLTAIRERDLDVPVLIMTGGPSLDTAIAAVEYGANCYLTKPLRVPEIRDRIRRAMQAASLARAGRDLAQVVGDEARQISDLAGLSTRFERSLAAAFMHFQPIVRWSNRSVFAYEALVRSCEPTMSRPDAIFDAADRLNRVIDVGRRIRSICCEPLRQRSEQLFVNLHTGELVDEVLFDRESPLARMAARPRLSHRPLDDIGAGYAGLTSFAVLEPDFIKLDRTLVQDFDTSPTKQRLVGAMLRACSDLGVHVAAEGIETVAEREALVDSGCDLFQGFLFGRPGEPLAMSHF